MKIDQKSIVALPSVNVNHCEHIYFCICFRLNENHYVYSCCFGDYRGKPEELRIQCTLLL